MIKASQLKFMQRMLLFIVLTSTVVLTSCRKEGCTDTIAENYTADAEDEDGSCTYYSDKFIGGYDVSESCSVGTTVFSIVVNESDNGKEYIVISNFGDYGVNITAEVIGNNIKFNESKDGIDFEGSGSIAESTLTIIYSATDGVFTDNCTMTCIKN